MIMIRFKHQEDQPAIDRVNQEVFGREAKARLVDALRCSRAGEKDFRDWSSTHRSSW